jgi:exodeoxyribonuclease VII small subunit
MLESQPLATESLTSRFEHWDFVLVEGTFEESLAVLEEIVGHLDEGHLTLDDSLRCYEFGVLISRRCEKMLDEAELRISRLETDPGEPDIEEPIDEAPF